MRRNSKIRRIARRRCSQRIHVWRWRLDLFRRDRNHRGKRAMEPLAFVDALGVADRLFRQKQGILRALQIEHEFSGGQRDAFVKTQLLERIGNVWRRVPHATKAKASIFQRAGAINQLAA